MYIKNPILHRRKQPGFLNHPLYRIFMDSVGNVPGNFIEMGIYRGGTFQHLYEYANRYGKQAIAVDSFEGLAEPASDVEAARYPKGGFDGFAEYTPDRFRKDYPGIVIYEGWIPDVLNEIQPGKFAFVHLDLDHELPTRAALEWVWPRISDQGILVCHDFAFDDKYCAARAISEWMRDHKTEQIGVCDNSIFFRKGES